MNEILQSQQSVKLYEYDYDKPPLEEETLMHYGVLGMKWGVRKDKKKKIFGSRKKKKKDKYRSNEDAIAAKDLKYINKNKDKFSTKELNQVMNRVDAEKRLNDMVKGSSGSTRKKIKKIFKSKTFKVASTIAVSLFAVSAVAYYKDKFGYPRKLPDFSRKQRGIIPDAIDIGKKAAKSTRKKAFAGGFKNFSEAVSYFKNFKQFI